MSSTFFLKIRTHLLHWDVTEHSGVDVDVGSCGAGGIPACGLREGGRLVGSRAPAVTASPQLRLRLSAARVVT